MARWDEKRGCWRICIEISRAGGRRRRRYLDVHEANTRAGRKAAELEEARLRLEVAQALEAAWPGRAAEGYLASFAAAAEGWVERKKGRWSPKTTKETRYALKRYILPTLGELPLNRVSPARIETLYAQWDAAGFKASSQRRWHGIIRSIFADSERLGELGGPNPMIRVQAAGGRAPERPIPSPEDVRAVIDAAPNLLAALFFELAAATGARRGTLLGLRWRNVDLEAGTIEYEQAVAQGEDGPVLKANKGGKVYSVRLAGPGLDALRAQRLRATETALALEGVGRLDDLFVFSDDGGRKHWNVGWPSHAWHDSCLRAGLPPFHLHDLRHFAATRLLSASIPTRSVADRLGCTENNVIRTYSHRIPGPQDDEAARIMAQLLGRIKGVG